MQTIADYSYGDANIFAYLLAVHELLNELRESLLRESLADSKDEECFTAFLEIQLVDAGFCHPLLVLDEGGSDFAITLPAAVYSSSDAPVVLEGQRVRCIPTDSRDAENSWPHIFEKATELARAVIWVARKSRGRTERNRITTLPIRLDLRPADAILEGFSNDIELFVKDASVGATFFLAAADVLLRRSPSQLAATGSVGQVGKNGRYDAELQAVQGVGPKFHFAAASRYFDVFCLPRIDDLSSEIAAFIDSEASDYVTLARARTVTTLLDISRRNEWKLSRSNLLARAEPSGADSDPLSLADFANSGATWLRKEPLHLAGLTSAIERWCAGKPAIATLRLSSDVSWTDFCVQLLEITKMSDEMFRLLVSANDPKSRGAALSKFLDRERPLRHPIEIIPDILVVAIDEPQTNPEYGFLAIFAEAINSASQENLFETRRRQSWGLFPGTVRVVLIQNKRVFHRRGQTVTDYDRALLSSLNFFRGYFTDSQAIMVAPRNPRRTRLEVLATLESLAAQGFLSRMELGWSMAPRGRKVANNIKGALAADLHAKISASFAPQLSPKRPVGAVRPSLAFNYENTLEALFHANAMKKNEKSLGVANYSSFHRVTLAKNLYARSKLFDLPSTWDGAIAGNGHRRVVVRSAALATAEELGLLGVQIDSSQFSSAQMTKLQANLIEATRSEFSAPRVQAAVTMLGSAIVNRSQHERESQKTVTLDRK